MKTTRKVTTKQLEKLLNDLTNAREAMSRALVCNQELVRHEWTGGNNYSCPPPELEALMGRFHSALQDWTSLETEVCLLMCRTGDDTCNPG